MKLNAPWRTLGFTAALAASVCGAHAQSGGLKFEPLELDYAKHCLKPPAIKVDRDWTKWTGEKIATPSQKLIDIADAYSSGSGDLVRDSATARRILDYLQVERRYRDGQTVVLDARLVFDANTDKQAMAQAVKDLEAEFARGNTSSTYLLGQAYELGLGVAADKKKALQFYRLSATVGNTSAMIRTVALVRASGGDEADQRIATISALTDLVSAVERRDCSAAGVLYNVYQSGELGVQDEALAIRWYEIVAKSGNVRAAMRLANFYRLGRGVSPDIRRSTFFTEMAADAGDPKGAYETGRAYSLGLGVTPDFSRAVRYLEQAGAGGVDKAWIELARIHAPKVNPGADPRVRFRYLELGANVKEPDPALLVDYATALQDGIGTNPDQKAAVAPLQKAAEAGSATAAWLLGKLYFYRNDGIEHDTKRGLELIRFAATSGEHAAALQLATLYRCGANVEQSAKKADLWQERAAFFGNSSAMHDLAVKEEKSDPLLAELYLRQAARHGSGEAVVELVNAYNDGQWSKPDTGLAERWDQYVSQDGKGELRDDVRIVRALVLKGSGDLSSALALLSEDGFLDLGRAASERGRVLGAMGGDSVKKAEASFEQAVTSGNTAAMWELSSLAELNGEALGHDKDYWLTAAANLGHTKAMIAVAEGQRDLDALEAIFESGKACSTKDLLALARAVLTVDGQNSRVKVMSYVSTAESMSETEDSKSLASVGEALISLGLDDQTRRRGELLLEKAAAAGDVDAARRLGIALAATADNVADTDKAIGYLLTALKPGDDRPAKMLLQSLRQASPGKTPMAFSKLDAMAVGLSSSVLKKVQELSFGEDAVSELGNALIDHAADKGNPAALVILADRKFSGFKTQRDVPAGMLLLEKAAQTGDPEAVRALSAAHEAGFGVAQVDTPARQTDDGANALKGESLQ
jgi:TPR repeat protein